MKPNESMIDRMLRISVGTLMLCLMAFGVIGIWGLVGLVPLATGLLGTCPVYSMLGIGTCEAPAT